MTQQRGRIIIVEGMDNTGKTTFITETIRGIGRGDIMAKVSLGPNRPAPTQTLWVLDQYRRIRQQDNMVIYDRFLPICDTVYGPIVRGSSIWGSNTDNWAIEELKDLKPLIIYCRPSDEVVLSFKDGRDQMEGVMEKGKELLTCYDIRMAELIQKGFEVLVYDYNKPNTRLDINKKIKGILGGMNYEY